MSSSGGNVVPGPSLTSGNAILRTELHPTHAIYGNVVKGVGTKVLDFGPILRLPAKTAGD